MVDYNFSTDRIIGSKEIKNYFGTLMQKTKQGYEVAEAARSKGLDSIDEVEIPLATDLAERTEILIGPKGVAKRYRELYAETEDRTSVMFTIFKEIVEGKLGDEKTDEKRLEKAIRCALTIQTEGSVTAPIEGIAKVQILKNPDGTKYVTIYFAGPIRAAGGTAAVLPLVLGDYGKKLLGLDRYKPDENEVKRYIEEIKLYHERVSRLQYNPKDEEISTIVKNCPVCVDGEPTSEVEVSINRGLKRVETNRIRGGMCLVIGEGVAQKAPKIIKFGEKLDLDWSWLKKIIKLEKTDKGGQKELAEIDKYLGSLVAGRPIFSYPMRFGGFRVRLGRGRNTGIMGKAIHPAAMAVLWNFPAVGTQFKIERIGKSAGIAPCDTIEPPIVKLKNGSIKRIETRQTGEKLRSDIDKIIFLGDFLCSYGDFRKSGHPLVPLGYCEEWWAMEVEKASLENKKNKNAGESPGFAKNPLPDCANTTPEQAVEISKTLSVAMHPRYTPFLEQLSIEELTALREKLSKAQKITGENKKLAGIKLNLDSELAEIFEKICLEHEVENDGKTAKITTLALPLLEMLGLNGNEKNTSIPKNIKDPLKAITHFSGIKIKNKGGTFLGARMGRPEAASERLLSPAPHILFPIGTYGGPTRDISKAARAKDEYAQIINVELTTRKCIKCNFNTHHIRCPKCNEKTQRLFKCVKCGLETLDSTAKMCRNCGSKLRCFKDTPLNITKELKDAVKKTHEPMPKLLKGVRGMINDLKSPEPLAKGVLRAKYNLHIYKDSTIRFEMINMPISHFKPCEINLSVEKAKELGYTKDKFGKPLKDPEQMLELFPQDIIIAKIAGDFMVKVTNFIDDLLTKFYGLEPFYSCTAKEQLIGELTIGLAPHTSAGVISRIIGFTTARACFAHPFFHLAKRRNTDGDQDSIMLLMDSLLNFSHDFLPTSKGGKMDTPLVLSVTLDPREIDDEAHEIECVDSYPLEIYEGSWKVESPYAYKIPIVENRLGTEKQYDGLGFSHDTAQFDNGPSTSSYITLESMVEKIQTQIELQGKIKAVDSKDATERVINGHFMPDMIGNLRSHSKQQIRCTACNAKFRRMPLNGKCTKCKKDKLVLTIHEGSVKKYLQITKEITEKYHLSNYLKQRVMLIEREIQSVFENDQVKQTNLSSFM
ncbi:MAG: DNA polymerase II large subunit [Candidatus Diapherotrites archaeon]|nr:DNA polymerase II large subunit [Candidatus Diapherotrites archaeon]